MAQYAEIVEIVAPDKAGEGGRVDIIVRIMNRRSAMLSIMVGGALEYGVSPWPTITYPGDKVDVPAGWIGEFSGYFTMPSSDVVIHAYSYWRVVGSIPWNLDDTKTKNVNLSVLSPAFSAFKITDYRKV